MDSLSPYEESFSERRKKYGLLKALLGAGKRKQTIAGLADIFSAPVNAARAAQSALEKDTISTPRRQTWLKKSAGDDTEDITAKALLLAAGAGAAYGGANLIATVRGLDKARKQLETPVWATPARNANVLYDNIGRIPQEILDEGGKMEPIHMRGLYKDTFNKFKNKGIKSPDATEQIKAMAERYKIVNSGYNRTLRNLVRNHSGMIRFLKRIGLAGLMRP